MCRFLRQKVKILQVGFKELIKIQDLLNKKWISMKGSMKLIGLIKLYVNLSEIMAIKSIKYCMSNDFSRLVEKAKKS